MSAPDRKAACWPQGTCPKPWVAIVEGKALLDGRGGLRRFSTEKAATKAAIAKATIQPLSGGEGE